MTNDRIYWQIPLRVVVLKTARNASIDLVRSDNKSLLELVDSGAAPVHMIIDASNVGMIPGDIAMTDELLALFSSPKLGYTMVVGFHQQDMPILRSARDAITHLTGKPIEFASSFADALAHFRQNDPTLDT